MNKFFTLLLLVLLTMSCTGSRKTDMVKYVDPSSFAPLLAQVESVSVIPLENADYSRPWNIDLFIDDGYYYLVDKEKCIVNSYSPSGQRHRQFGQKGRGPGEFLNIKNIQIREEDLLVFSSPKTTVTYYDKSGRFIKRDNLDVFGFQNFFVNEGLLNFNGYGSPMHCKASLWKDGAYKEFFPYSSEVMSFSDSFSVFSSEGKDIFVRDICERTIYRYRDGKLAPYLSFDFGEYAISDSWYEMDEMASAVYFMEKDICLITRFAKSENKILVEVTRPLIHKSTYGLFQDGEWTWFSAGTEEQDPFASAIKTMVGNELICMVDASLLDKVCPELLEKVTDKETLSRIKPETNHVIIRIRLKQRE